MFWIHLHATFHMPSYSGSFVITINPKAKHFYKFNVVVMLLLHILQKQRLNKGSIFFKRTVPAPKSVRPPCSSYTL
jgi:hypothetical protein